MILDTTFIIDLLENDKSAVKKATELVERAEAQIITSISVFELFDGISRSNRPAKEKQKVIAGLQSIEVLSLTEISARKAGFLHGRLVNAGRRVDSHDCMIAGIALENNQKVLTRNIKHFSRFDDLQIENY